jgi:hypothetical protein
MVDVWTWSAGDHCCGVSGSAERAKGRAGENLAVGDTARVEKVCAELGFRIMSSYYVATGTGWTGIRTDRGIDWRALHGTGES